MSRTRLRAAKIGLVSLAFLVLPAFATSNYLLRVFTVLIVFILFTIGLNVVFGHTDQLYLFVGGLAGVSGYTSAILADSYGITPWAMLPVGVVAAGLLGFVVSYIAAKRRFTVILIAIFTLAIQLSLTEFLVGARSLTGGSTGMTIQGIGVGSRLVFYYLFFAVFVAFLVGYDRLVHSRYGLAFDAIRQDDLAAATIGVDVVRYKVFAGVLGAMMIGLVGGLYGFSAGHISPTVYSFMSIDVAVLIMLTLGGMRTTLGPVVGGVFVIWINEWLAATPRWRLVVFGVLLIVLYLYFREGIVPTASDFLAERGIDVGEALGESSTPSESNPRQ